MVMRTLKGFLDNKRLEKIRVKKNGAMRELIELEKGLVNHEVTEHEHAKRMPGLEKKVLAYDLELAIGTAKRNLETLEKSGKTRDKEKLAELLKKRDNTLGTLDESTSLYDSGQIGIDSFLTSLKHVHSSLLDMENEAAILVEESERKEKARLIAEETARKIAEAEGGEEHGRKHRGKEEPREREKRVIKVPKNVGRETEHLRGKARHWREI